MQSCSGQSTPLNGNGNGFAARAVLNLLNQGHAKASGTRRYNTLSPRKTSSRGTLNGGSLSGRILDTPFTTRVTPAQWVNQSGQAQRSVMSRPRNTAVVRSQEKFSAGSGTLS